MPLIFMTYQDALDIHDLPGAWTQINKLNIAALQTA